MTHYHLHHTHNAGEVESYDDIVDAVEALGEALQDWAEAQFQRPREDQHADADLAYGLAESLRNRDSEAVHDEVARVRRYGCTSYTFGTYIALVNACQAPGCPRTDETVSSC